MIQPIADDLYWIQVEDFVDIFNRIYIVTDLSFDKRGVCKRYVSKWLPGDYIAGAGGPPIVITKEPIEDNEEEDQQENDDEDGKSEEKKEKPIKYQKIPLINENFTDNPMYPFAVTEPTTMVLTLYQQDKRWNSEGRYGTDPTVVPTSSFMSRKDRYESVMKYSIGIGFLIVRLSGLKIRLTDFQLKKISYTSDYVTFSNTSSAVLTLFPGRYAVIPFTHCALDRMADYVLHSQYLNSHVEWEIEDVIAQRLQDKEPSEDGNEGGGNYYDEEADPEDNELLMIHNDDNLDGDLESKINETNMVNFPPKPQKKKKGLASTNNQQSADHQQPPGNSMISGEEDNRLIMTDNVTILSYEKYKPSNLLAASEEEKRRNANGDDNDSQVSLDHRRPLVPVPRLFFVPFWEYREEVESLSTSHLYLEVNEMMKYVRSLKNEIRKLHTQMKSFS
jgi:hypothetical protein